MNQGVKTIFSIIIILVGAGVVWFAIRNEGTATYVSSSQNAVLTIDDVDYNFDGYNDLYRLSSNKEDVMSYKLSLYDPIAKRFVYNAELSKLNYLEVDKEKEYLLEDASYYLSTGEHVDGLYKTYKWVDDHLVKIEE